jgi:hypothetical protein
MLDRLVAGGVMAATVPLTVQLHALTTLTVLLLVSALRVIWEVQGGNDPLGVPLKWRLPTFALRCAACLNAGTYPRRTKS